MKLVHCLCFDIEQYSVKPLNIHRFQQEGQINLEVAIFTHFLVLLKPILFIKVIQVFTQHQVLRQHQLFRCSKLLDLFTYTGMSYHPGLSWFCGAQFGETLCKIFGTTSSSNHLLFDDGIRIYQRLELISSSKLITEKVVVKINTTTVGFE